LRRTAFLAFLLALAVTAVHGQTEEDTASPQDSLEVTEEVEVPADTQPEPTEEPEEVRIPGQPTAVLESFFQALRTGDSLMVSALISDEGLESIGIMLDILKENLDDDPETVMSRLSSAGYQATADQVDDWSPMEYLTATVVLPIMKARYSMYDMNIGDFTISGDRLQVPLVFTTASGVELPFEAELVKQRDDWKVTTFMGLSSFP